MTATQTFPFPDELARLVDELVYRPGWHFELGHVVRDTGPDGEVLSEGLTLSIVVHEGDAYRPRPRGTIFYRPVPPATYRMEDWRRWLFDQVLAVELHEAMEYFVVAGERPYAPTHGPGRDPHTIVEYRDEVDRRTRPDGTVVD